AMIAAARKNGRMLSVFHNRRWDGDYMTIKDVIARGLIGEVFHIEACMGNYGHPGFWWRSDKRIAGGAFYDWGAHVCDWVLGLVPSEIAEVSGHFQPKRVWHDVTNEDHCSAMVRFANGVSAHIELSHLAAVGKRRWRILGTRGGIEDSPHGQNTFRVVSYKEGVRLESDVAYRESDWHAYYRNVADHLLTGAPLAVTPESARRVIALIETAEQSSRAGKAMPVPKHCR
ncbi:MAG: Gfo/Idh/MocA family oxidoreductase, partial [Candidatus Hydrogenedentes bacterium]|nr:Gfo/Idh/MocA family oxidoreductase [Candidatus Hydrogenedentota bacterium]